jgi:hypothetical protein
MIRCCSFWDARGHWKITQHMYRQMPEQLGGGCSGIWRARHPDSGTSPHPARGRRARRGSGYADIYLPVQGPCK